MTLQALNENKNNGTSASCAPHQQQSSSIGIVNTSLEATAANQHIVDRNVRARQEADVFPTLAMPAEDYPVIDLSPFTRMEEHTDKEREAVLDQIIPHAISSGSFNIIGHGIPLDLLERLEKASRDFFGLPLAEKERFNQQTNLAGYTAYKTESNEALYGNPDKKDLREVYGAIATRQSATNDPDELKAPLDEYMEHMNRLDKLLHVICTRMLAKIKGVDLPDDFLEQAKGGMLSYFRVSHYPDDAEPEPTKNNKLGAHSDWGTLTMLYSQDKGLEEIRDGRWYEVPIQPGEIHVALADILYFLSNGLFVHNVHRVSEQASGQDRISFAYFACQIENGSKREKVEPVCSENESPIIEPFSAAEFFENNLKALALKLKQ